MTSRRGFLTKTALTVTGLSLSACAGIGKSKPRKKSLQQANYEAARLRLSYQLPAFSSPFSVTEEGLIYSFGEKTTSGRIEAEIQALSPALKPLWTQQFRFSDTLTAIVTLCPFSTDKLLVSGVSLDKEQVSVPWIALLHQGKVLWRKKLSSLRGATPLSLERISSSQNSFFLLLRSTNQIHSLLIKENGAQRRMGTFNTPTLAHPFAFHSTPKGYSFVLEEKNKKSLKYKLFSFSDKGRLRNRRTLNLAQHAKNLTLRDFSHNRQGDFLLVGKEKNNDLSILSFDQNERLLGSQTLDLSKRWTTAALSPRGKEGYFLALQSSATRNFWLFGLNRAGQQEWVYKTRRPLPLPTLSAIPLKGDRVAIFCSERSLSGAPKHIWLSLFDKDGKKLHESRR